MYPLSDKAACSEKVLFVFYDFETTQNTECTDTSFKHVPNLVCVQQFCTVCEDVDEVEMDCRRCGKKSAVSVWALSEISFPTFSTPVPGGTESWPSLKITRNSTYYLY